MARRLGKRSAMGLMLSSAGILVALFGYLMFAGPATPAAAQPPAGDKVVPAKTPYIEAHTHFNAHDPEGAVQAALRALARQNAVKILFLSPPDTYEDPGRIDSDVILPAAKKYPGKIAVLGGGGTLNAMIEQAVRTGYDGPEVRRKFRERAEEILRKGMVGFGEMAAEHFPAGTPYQYAPPDHPLFLLLADIAAQHDVPIDLHMEAVPRDMPLPAGLKSPPNPPRLRGNIAAFERLLDHNPRAKIIWAHAGSDSTGYRTPELCRRLLAAHPNLYMEIKVDPLHLGKTPPIDASGKIKPAWRKLFEDFPNRFLIGSDQNYPEPKTGPQRWQADVLLLNQLPPELRRKIGRENALHLYFPKQGRP
jgi:predicted TIM-barrel fold metal-dependent hydrolase